MTDPLDTITNALHAAGKTVKRSGTRIMAQCPAHPDRTPSLAITHGTNQPVILKCHAGCQTTDILTALNLTWADISTDNTPTVTTEPVHYTYTDADGTTLYRVVRTPDKRFWQQHPHPDTGEWTNGRGPHQPTLYRLPATLNAIQRGDTIYIVEGEKDVDTLTRAGHTATCNLGGAGKFTDHMADQLIGATRVHIIADNDQPGHDHARHIATLLAARNIPHQTWTPTHGKDISQQLGAGIPLDRLTPLTADTPVTPGDDLAHIINWDQFWTQTHDDEQWIAWPLIPRGRTVSLYAPAKAGKSTILLAVITAAVTGQQPLGNNTHPQTPCSILYLDYEMSTADLHERLTQLGYGPGSNLTRLHYALLPTIPALDTPEGGQHLHNLATTLNVDAVVVDTIGRAVQGEENSADTIRAFYRHTAQPLKAAGISVLRTDHAGKDTDKGQRGTSAKNDDVDIVYKLTRNNTGVTLQRTHSRITWAPDNIPITYTENDNGTVTVTITPRHTYPDGTNQLAELIDQLNIPEGTSARQTERQLRDLGHKYRSTLIRAAVQLRNERIIRNPFGDDDSPVDNCREPVENPPRSASDAPRTENSDALSGRAATHPTKPLLDDPDAVWDDSGRASNRHRDAPRVPSMGRGATQTTHSDLDNLI
jgi:5S rRNA maturation endonuclease (ribonuclease M5)